MFAAELILLGLGFAYWWGLFWYVIRVLIIGMLVRCRISFEVVFEYFVVGFKVWFRYGGCLLFRGFGVW